MAAGTEGTWMSLTYGAYPEHVAQKAYEKELRRLETLRDITVTVVPSPPAPDSPTTETEAAALDFDPFTFTVSEEATLSTLARLCKASLPDTGPPYEFRVGKKGRMSYRVSEQSVALVNVLLGPGEIEVEVRVSVAPPPGYKKGKGKGVLGRLGLR